MSLLALSNELLAQICDSLVHDTLIFPSPSSLSYFTVRQRLSPGRYKTSPHPNVAALLPLVLTCHRLYAIGCRTLTAVLVSEKQTLLQYAALTKDTALISRLLSVGASHIVRDADNRTALHHACTDPKDAEELHQCKQHQSRAFPARGEAATLSTVQLLLSSGACQSGIDNSGRYPLHYAGISGYLSVLSELLSSSNTGNENPALSAEDEDGYTPLDHAAVLSHEDAAELLIAHGAQLGSESEMRLCRAVYLRRIPAVERYLAAGAYPTYALLEAVRAGAVEVVDLMVRHGVDLNERVTVREFVCTFGMDLEDGQDDEEDLEPTPLWEAARRGSAEVVDLLIAGGARVSGKVYAQDSVLHCLIRERVNEDMLERLVKAGALVDVRGEQGKTAREMAKERGLEKLMLVIDQCAGKK